MARHQETNPSNFKSGQLVYLRGICGRGNLVDLRLAASISTLIAQSFLVSSRKVAVPDEKMPLK